MHNGHQATKQKPGLVVCFCGPKAVGVVHQGRAKGTGYSGPREGDFATHAFLVAQTVGRAGLVQGWRDKNKATNLGILAAGRAPSGFARGTRLLGDDARHDVV